MERSQHRPVTGRLADGLNIFNDSVLIHLLQHFFSEIPGNRLHLIGNRGIFRRQIRMAFSGIYDHQIVAQLIEIAVYLPDAGIFNVREINGDDASHGTGQLIQQAGAFHPVFVLRILSRFGIGNHVPLSAVEQIIHHHAHQHLKGCGGADARAADHVTGHISVKAFHLHAAVFQARENASQQRLCPCGFLHGLQVIQIHRQVLMIRLTDQLHRIGAVGRCGCHAVQMYAASQNLSMVVIRMVSADLRSSGSREEFKLFIAELLYETFRHHLIPLRVFLHPALSIHLGEKLYHFFIFHMLYQFLNLRCFHIPSPLVDFSFFMIIMRS